MKKYLIIKEEDCQECGGRKRPQCEDFFWCKSCNGTGKIRKEVDFVDALIKTPHSHKEITQIVEIISKIADVLQCFNDRFVNEEALKDIEKPSNTVHVLGN